MTSYILHTETKGAGNTAELAKIQRLMTEWKMDIDGEKGTQISMIAKTI